MTSLPKLSKTRTFQMGWPFASRMGVDLGSRPLGLESWCSSVFWSEVWLRLRIFSMEAAARCQRVNMWFARGFPYQLGGPSSCGRSRWWEQPWCRGTRCAARQLAFPVDEGDEHAPREGESFGSEWCRSRRMLNVGGCRGHGALEAAEPRMMRRAAASSRAPDWA